MGLNTGQRALGLDDVQKDKLFREPRHIAVPGTYVYSMNPERGWPVDLAKKYVKARGPKQRAQITADRIDRFIATNGAE